MRKSLGFGAGMRQRSFGFWKKLVLNGNSDNKTKPLESKITYETGPSGGSSIYYRMGSPLWGPPGGVHLGTQRMFAKRVAGLIREEGGEK